MVKEHTVATLILRVETGIVIEPGGALSLGPNGGSACSSASGSVLSCRKEETQVAGSCFCQAGSGLRINDTGGTCTAGDIDCSFAGISATVSDGEAKCDCFAGRSGSNCREFTNVGIKSYVSLRSRKPSPGSGFTDSITCSGHGTALPNGECNCEQGYGGMQCDVLGASQCSMNGER